ncbi:MAG: rhodanese-like domain-containing protein [Methanotrichaceae archaeon]|nr:rhodanese-like domain-containing protein [Methanotrichaceae archaeon]
MYLNLRFALGAAGVDLCPSFVVPNGSAFAAQICGRKDSRKAGKRYPDDSLPLAILDVRTPEEYSSGHLEGAANLDFRSPSFRDSLTNLDKKRAYLVYCRTGIRSGRALVIMADLGFSEVYNLSGGIFRWNREGFDVAGQQTGGQGPG